MIVPIQRVAPLPEPSGIRPAGESPSGGSFQDALTGAIREVEQFGRAADGSVERFLNGEGEELHAAVLSAQRAEMAFDLFLQARNKVVQAYQEIMRMQM